MPRSIVEHALEIRLLYVPSDEGNTNYQDEGDRRGDREPDKASAWTLGKGDGREWKRLRELRECSGEVGKRRYPTRAWRSRRRSRRGLGLLDVLVDRVEVK